MVKTKKGSMVDGLDGLDGLNEGGTGEGCSLFWRAGKSRWDNLFNWRHGDYLCL